MTSLRHGKYTLSVSNLFTELIHGMHSYGCILAPLDTQ